MILRFILLTLLNLVANFLNYFLAPIAVLFASESGWLPNWLSWFGTPDNSLDGDIGWKVEHRPFKVEDNKFKRWVNRTAWLWRNSMYGLSETVLGFTVQPDFIYRVEGDEAVGNRPIVNGLVKRTLITGGKKYWQWYYVKVWHPKYCIRINLGWKLAGLKQVGEKIPIVFSPNPFMGYLK